MRFKARLLRDSVQCFIGVVQAVSKISNTQGLGGECVIHLTRESFELRVLMSGSSTIVVDREVQAFARLNRNLFHEFFIESKAGDTISFMLSISSLLSAFMSADHADEALFKLTKKNGVSCFTIVAQTINNISVTQDVLITKLLSGQDMENYQEPTLPPPQICIKFPEPRHVRTVLERMKGLDKFVQLSLHKRGTLIIKTQTEIVSMRTIWQNLQLPDEEEASRSEESSSAAGGEKRTKCKVRASIKDLLPITFCNLTKYKEVLLCVVVSPRHQALIVYVVLEKDFGTLAYFLPITCDDDEEMIAAEEEEGEEKDMNDEDV